VVSGRERAPVDQAVEDGHACPEDRDRGGGDIWISTRAVAGSSQLAVVNTGLVISPADAARIFEPFQRLHDRTSRDGSGLGLAIVDSIAAIHGAAIDARPNPGGDLIVKITFPSPSQPQDGPELA
jgi:signal transduction histidine kinase